MVVLYAGRVAERADTGRIFADAAHPYTAALMPVSYTHLRAHATVLDLECRLLLDKHNYTSKP